MTTACLDSYMTKSSSPAPHPTLLDSTLPSFRGPFESFVPMDLSSLLAPVQTSPAVTGADVAVASAPNSALSALSTSMLSEPASASSFDAVPDFQPFLLESTTVAAGSMPTPSFSPAMMSTSLPASANMAALTSSPVPKPGTLFLDPSFMPGGTSPMLSAMPSPTPSPSIGFPQSWSMRSVDAPQRTPSLPVQAMHAPKMSGRRMSMPMLPSSLSICSTTPPPPLPTLHEVSHASAPISPADSTGEMTSSGLPMMMAPLAVPAPARRMSVGSASASGEKTRSKLTREQMATLKRVYAITYFPDKATKEQLARELGLTTRVVQVRCDGFADR
ncbi:hypothetical protein AMAG_05753 [Allomyces macrogynus ATCC 38327]|uniref:Homeobox domain-containing protein n=1 Tax=Allomyces macrogynus (strain ATCC 38327) TaxID=578462 RepID=A0A0L0SCT7_ALLM3|nr:hypothetical protein AMAG_05753 [Allomyces macrogynus ATCC 38327]|eukprot:KNE60358.1 hypothetical protein AMAG_05753 [Allomyces macrogynus ATCC 38327]